MTDSRCESGMTLMAVMIFMTIFAFVLMLAAPSIQMDVQREKELEAIRRGEEITNAIHQFVLFHQGTKLPKSLDELVEGLPDGTRKRQILRPSSTTDPLTLDGRWRLIQPDPDTIARFAKRVQIFNNGILPSSPQPTRFYDRYTVTLANVLNTESATDPEDDEEDMTVEDNVPFIGVASQSRMQSVVTYYGIENHSKWIFTPLFRGAGATSIRPGIRPDIRPPVR
ncbi:MAG TPA: type II secretion system protein [Pyrinomonadaceae bacterium]|nr:type II secretion system protein [Pyrinomonadaceae bacterium]